MIHIYGHTWPIRWGDPGEPKMVKVYSNCDEVELFLGDRSLGTKRRNSQDFPAAGLRWTTPFPSGKVSLRAVGKRNGKIVSDQIQFTYETRKWSTPAHFQLREITRDGKLVTVEALLTDASGVPCLDARNVSRFSVAGDGQMLDNLGTVGGSRVVQLANGRGWMTVRLSGSCTLAVACDGVQPTTLALS